MKKLEIEIQGYKLPYFIKDNNLKKTILIIHGFNSSASFCEKLFQKENNYNIISLGLPRSNINPNANLLTIEEIASLVNKFINCINTKICVLGHSLAGAILTKIHNNPQIKELIFLSTIHPKIIDVKTYQLLRKYKSFISNTKGFEHIIKKEIFNEKYITETLNKEFQSINKKTLFAVGNHDFIIGTKQLEKYVKNCLNKKIFFFQNVGHNPIKNKPELVNNWLNSNYAKKKRIFKKNIIPNLNFNYIKSNT